ncbi:MAG TPA: type I-C CRISPR-associated protein Cas5c [Dehalococcoidia bacterium]|nr:type I-C CRISPR-associated protein Cas5c [Dehalococcoidia bacterium]
MTANTRDGPLQVQVWGDFACFTRPEMKVERVTYPVMTPSAARGVLEAIFWKPEFDWRVERIEVLRPIRYFSILRNEVNSRQSERAARGWAGKGGAFVAEDDRAQRHTLALRDVAYRITASIELRPHATDDIAKYRDQFRRRVEGGRCFATPYLGCREFSAGFGPPTGARPIALTEDLGLMLRDIQYEPGGGGRGTPRFFAARLEAGVLHVPPQDGGDG